MLTLPHLLLFALLASVLAHRPPYNTASRRKEGALNVHFVPHTHDDVGWLKNIDEYYVGARQDIQRAGVYNILTAVIHELAWNPDRRFIYVEQAFFQRFWDDIDTKTAEVVRQLVASGQLEFINGGYSMHDEACPSYVDMLDQTTLGHRLLKSQFGVAPKSAWQIDPFGHSSFQSSVLSSPAAGFNSVFFMRADWQEIALRQNRTTTEMVWAPSPSLGLTGATFAGILYGGYCTLPGLSRDFFSNDPPLRDSPYLEDNNVAAFVNATVATALAALLEVPQGGPGADATADVLFLLGCDFAHENAGSWFSQTDKLIHYLNLDGRVNAFYSSPSMYAAAKLSGAKAYTLKTSDFFPYDFFPHGYLTGFFTSRPALKGYIRGTSSLLQAAKQLQAFTGGAADLGRSNPLFRLERAMGEAQHHDAITGSSKQAVAFDYARRLAWGREDAQVLLAAALTRLSSGSGSSNATPPAAAYPWAPCDLANATMCAALEALLPTALNVYNSASSARSFNVRLPVPLAPPSVASWVVLGRDGATPMPAQLLPLSAADIYLRENVHGHFAGGLNASAICARNLGGNYSSSSAGEEGEVYTVTWMPGAAFRVVRATSSASSSASSSSSSAWATASGAFTDASLRGFAMNFTSATGVLLFGLSGVVDAACSGFAFANGAGGSSSAPGTAWQRLGPPLPPPQVMWLAFQVPSVPPMGFATVFLAPSSASPGSGALAAGGTASTAVLRSNSSSSAMVNLTNGLVTLSFDSATGELVNFAQRSSSSSPGNISLPFTNHLFYYAASQPTLFPPGPPSGAYIMRSNGTMQDIDAGAGAGAGAVLTLLTGPVCSEARLVFPSGWATQTLRLWAGEGGGYEAEYTLGPLPTAGGDANGGKEVCALVGAPSLSTGGVFFTDSNHRDAMQRTVNARADWNLTVEEPVAGNMYPAGGFLYATFAGAGGDAGGALGFSVLPDRAIGGGVVDSGAGSGLATLLLHRRLTLDDRLGVGEVLTEPGLDALGTGLIISTRHRVLVHAQGSSSLAEAAVARRNALVDMERFPLLSLLPLTPPALPASPAQFAAQHVTAWGGLAAAAQSEGVLPGAAEVVTLQSWGSGQVLLRVAHRFEVGDGGEVGVPVNASLAGLFNASSSGLTLNQCTETTVTGNAPLAEVDKVTYRILGGESVTLPVVPPPPSGPDGLGDFTLGPMAIRTFLCQASLAGGAPIVLQ